MKTIYRWLITLASLLVISMILTIFELNFLESLRIVFGGFYVLFLPGYFLTHLFFPKKLNNKEGIDFIERLALSFALSIAIVPLIVFYLNLIGMKINTLSAFLTILGIMLIISIIMIIKRKRAK